MFLTSLSLFIISGYLLAVFDLANWISTILLIVCFCSFFGIFIGCANVSESNRKKVTTTAKGLNLLSKLFFR